MQRWLPLCALFAAATLSCASQTPTPAPQPESFDTWAKVASAVNNSPVATEPGDEHVHWVAPDGRKIQLTVKVPRPLSTAPVVTLEPVPDGADARPYFEKALAEVRARKAGKLILPKAIYVFKTMDRSNTAQLVISGLTDVTIDGSGSELLFSLNKSAVHIDTSHRVALTNLTVNFSLKMAALGTVVQQGTEAVLKVDPAYPLSASDSMGHMGEWDVASHHPVAGGVRMYAPPGTKEVPKYIGDQTFTSPGFQDKHMLGKTFLMFLQWYGGAAIEIKDNIGPQASEDVIIRDVTINSGPGMGIIAYGVKRGVGIWNCRIEPKEGALISTEYDAIHMLLVGGDVSIHDNLIAGQGDDGINLNNPVHPIAKIDPDGKSLVLSTYSRFIKPHDRLSAFNEFNKYLGSAEVVDTPKSLGGPNNQWYGLTLSNAIPNLTLKSLFRDNDLIDSRVAVVHNTIRDCGCHGLLVQVPNVLVADNTFSNTSANAIRLITSVGFFKEGDGAVNVLVRNNHISGTGIDGGLHAMHWAAIASYGNGQAGITSEPSNKFLEITGNVITNAQQGCIAIHSSEDVKVLDNTCTNTNLAPASHRQPVISVYSSSHVLLSGNTSSHGPMMGGIDIDAASTADVHSQATF